MDSEPWVIPLAEAAPLDEQRIGGKAAQLARLHQAGFRVVPGFCVNVAAYEQFLLETQLQRVIQMELGRKPFEELRWEELWDAALRIRNRFSAAKLPRSCEPGDLPSGPDLGRRHALGRSLVSSRRRLCPAVFCGTARIVPVRGGGRSRPGIGPSGLGIFVVRRGIAVSPRTGPRSAHEPDGRVDPGNADGGPLRRRFWP